MTSIGGDGKTSTAGERSLTPREALRWPQVPSYILAQGLDQVGDILWFVTLGWVAAQAPSAIWTGLIFCAGALPAVAFTLLGGALIDRLGSGRVIVVTQAARLVAMLAWTAAMAADAPPLAVVPVLAFVISTIGGLHEPALEVFPTNLLPETGQIAAVGMERLTLRVAQVLGGAGGGWLLSEHGLAGPSVAAAGAFLIALGIFARIGARQPINPSPTKGSLLHAARTGLRAVAAHPVLSRTLPMQGIGNALTAGLTVAGYPLKAHAHGWSAAQFGAAYAAWAGGLFVGTIVGLRLVNRVQRKVRMALLLFGMNGMLIVGLGLTQHLSAFIVLAGLIGMVSGPAGPVLSGFVRAEAMTSPAGRGAILGVQTFAIVGIEPLGFVAVGAAVAALGADGGFMLVGAAVIANVLRALSSRQVRAQVSH